MFRLQVDDRPVGDGQEVWPERREDFVEFRVRGR
jgi:hypothetical protein